MNQSTYLNPDDVRSLFSLALSAMYKNEVPLYGDLLDLVADINADVLTRRVDQNDGIVRGDPPKRLEVERHGAIRLGTAAELAMMGRLFAVMGMEPVGYYDLSLAGLPVHATAFRPILEESLERNPFRVFTSLLRLELIEDLDLRERAATILSGRQIFSQRCIALIRQAESAGGLTADEAEEFVEEALETFRWHGEAVVDIETYNQLKLAHPLIADVVCFKGPHINHLTPRVLDIDRAQRAMLERGIPEKDCIEGPPYRRCPILLRQTSFLALNEPIRFVGEFPVNGSHTARFGEIEQRGCALTRKGRDLYDELLSESRARSGAKISGSVEIDDPFDRFPDDWTELRLQGLAYFRYVVSATAIELGTAPSDASDEALIRGGWIEAVPLTYEDFLPVSAAGIFRSNLRATEETSYETAGNQSSFEAALGRAVHNEIDLHESAQTASLARARLALD